MPAVTPGPYFDPVFLDCSSGLLCTVWPVLQCGLDKTGNMFPLGAIERLARQTATIVRRYHQCLYQLDVLHQFGRDVHIQQRSEPTVYFKRFLVAAFTMKPPDRNSFPRKCDYQPGNPADSAHR